MADIELLPANTRYFTEVSAPSTPSSGQGVLYAATDGTLHYLNDAATDLEIGSGGGASAIDDLSDVDTDKSKTPADGDVLTFDGTDWNAEAAAGGGGSSIATSRVRYTGGNISITYTSWTAVAGIGDLTVAASSGDVLLVSFSATFLNATASVSMDAYTIVSSTATNKISGGGGGTGTDFGIGAWSSDNTSIQNVGGSIQYVVQAGDIDGGNVVLRLYAIRFTNNKTLVANSGQPLFFQVANLGQ